MLYVNKNVCIMQMHSIKNSLHSIKNSVEL